MFEALIAESAALDQLCEIIKPFGSAVSESGFKVSQDFISPFHEGLSQSLKLRNF